MNCVPDSMPTHFQTPLKIGSKSREVADGRVTYLRMEASEFKTPALDDEERGELIVSIGGVWLR